MFGDATSQLLATLVLPVVAGFVCLFVVMIKAPPLRNALPKTSEPPAHNFSNIFGVLSVSDAYDPDRNVLWENQLFALQRIASDATIPELRTMWERYYLQLYPELYEGISFWEWLAFLKNCNLAESDGSVVRLTANGHEFLSLLTRNANHLRGKRVAHER
jgi:hypothetical protein